MANNQPHGAERHAPITVALVDDEPLIRAALGQALRSAGLELVAEAASGEDAIELVLELRPGCRAHGHQAPGHLRR
jgi:CheY-like chemotaxis protein